MVRTRKWAKTAAACALPAVRAAHRKIMACIMQMPEMLNNGLGETYEYWYRPLEVIALRLKCEPTTSLCSAAVAARKCFSVAALFRFVPFPVAVTRVQPIGCVPSHFSAPGVSLWWASCMVQQSNAVNGASFSHTRAIHTHQLSDLLSNSVRVLQ
jgi:hypothetical protein